MNHKTPSQRDHIRLHLESIDPVTQDTMGITAYEALGLYRCFRLAARIEELRDCGMKITSFVKTDKTGKKYAKYYLSTNKHAYLEGSVLSLPRNRR